MNQDHNTDERAELRNTLYRKIKKGRRQLTPLRMFGYRLAVPLASLLIRALWRSCRVTATVGLEGARAAIAGGRPVVPVYWHQHIVFGVRAVLLLKPAGLRLGFLISPSVDGTAPAMFVRRIGAEVIRGSSTHTGARALRDYYEAISKHGLSPAITPDGPRGPQHEFKPGAIMVSQLSGRPILPVSVAASHRIRFRTWDRFELPLPFSRIALAYGAPQQVPRGLDPAALEDWQRRMAQSLVELRAEAEAALARR